MKSVTELLRESREYLEAHGWNQHTLQHGGGSTVCAVGAIVYSQPWNADDINQDRVYEAHKQEIDEVCESLIQAGALADVHDCPKGCRNHAAHVVTHWNDIPSRSKQEVIDLFAKAEKIAEAGFDPDAS